MRSYTPTSLAILTALLIMLASVTLCGFVLQRLRPTWLVRALSWALVLAGIAGVERISAGEPAGLRMLTLVGCGLLALKTPIAVEARKGGTGSLPLARWLCFAGWPGMRPQVFIRRDGSFRAGSGGRIGSGLCRATLGVVLLLLARGRPRGFCCPCRSSSTGRFAARYCGPFSASGRERGAATTTHSRFSEAGHDGRIDRLHDDLEPEL